MGIEHEEIPEGDLHHPQIKSPTEWQTLNLGPRKPSKHAKKLGLDDYAYAQVVHYAIMQ